VLACPAVTGANNKGFHEINMTVESLELSTRRFTKTTPAGLRPRFLSGGVFTGDSAERNSLRYVAAARI
jgi:hypothetical protein